MWRKSSYSMANGNCIEVLTVNGAVVVRDAKDRNHSLVLSPDTWTRLVRDVQSAV